MTAGRLKELTTGPGALTAGAGGAGGAGAATPGRASNGALLEELPDDVVLA